MSADSIQPPSGTTPAGRDRWQIAAASICGTSHQHHGLPCQDAHAWAVLPSGAIAIAVADGAGSAAHSDRGSAIAVETVVEYLRDRADHWLADYCHHQPIQTEIAAIVAVTCPSDPETEPKPTSTDDADPALESALESVFEVAPKIAPETESELKIKAQALFDNVLEALQTEAKQQHWPLAELATTLVVMIADRWGAIAIQVGDGVAIVNDANKATIALTVPANGEYANETSFITSQAARDIVQVAIWRGTLAHLAVMTDGLQRLALNFPQATPHLPFFRPLFQFIAQAEDADRASDQLANFLTSPRVRDRADDDLTLLLACLASGDSCCDRLTHTGDRGSN